MSNIDTARSAYDAFSRGDLATVEGGMAENATWVTSDSIPPGGGTIEGREAIIANFAEIPSYWSTFQVEPEEFIDAGEYVIVRGTQRIGNAAGSFESPFAHILKYDGDGRIVRGEFFADTAKAAKLLD